MKIYKYIQIKTKDNVLNIILNRPKKRNALNPIMIEEIHSVFKQNIKNDLINVIVLSSSSNVFCAGADLQYLNNISKNNYNQNLSDSKKLMKLFKTMLSFPKLIISKVVGPAIAGGCGIATASDIIFCTPDSKFGYPEVKIGFIPALVSSFLKFKIKQSYINKLLLTGAIVSAKEAKEMGLVQHIYNKNDINLEIDNFIQTQTETTSSQSIAYTKKLLYELNNLDEKLNLAAQYNAKIRDNDDFKLGVKSFLNKNSINWKKIKNDEV
tara:strand:- start:709 stop:1509 length:801 start_codon:yes stop_codon:yes gene_type:complete